MGKVLKAVIEFADNNYSAYLVDVDGIIGIGGTLEDVKRSLLESIKYTVDEAVEDGLEIPEPLKGEYEVKFTFDLPTFLQLYDKVVSKSGLERITGINQKQLWHYANGLRRPKTSTVKRVSDSIHRFAEDLLSVEFA